MVSLRDEALRRGAEVRDREAPEGRRLPVIEIFGPTVQGEGVLAGLPTYFIRFGGCDWRCSWCDSMHAVEPDSVRELAEKLTEDEILARLTELVPGPEWVTLSGGNPALLHLGPLVRALRVKGSYKVAVETQGSKWRPWLADVDCLTISPKPPSSGMDERGARELPRFMEGALARASRSRDQLKIVAFDQTDLDWAVEVFRRYPSWPRYVSCGTVVGEPLEDLTERYRWLCETAARTPALARTRVLPQLHVVAWGHARGV